MNKIFPILISIFVLIILVINSAALKNPMGQGVAFGITMMFSFLLVFLTWVFYWKSTDEENKSNLVVETGITDITVKSQRDNSQISYKAIEGVCLDYAYGDSRSGEYLKIIQIHNGVESTLAILTEYDIINVNTVITKS